MHLIHVVFLSERAGMKLADDEVKLSDLFLSFICFICLC